MSNSIKTSLKNNLKNLNNNLKKTKPAVKLLKATSFIIFYVSNILILMYVLRLEKEKCECSKEKWMRDFIKYVAMINLALPVLFLLIAPVFPKIISMLVKSKSTLLLMTLSLLGLALALLGITFVVVILVYYVRLHRKSDCDCSLGPKRYFLLYPVVTFALSIVSFFLK